MSTGGFKQPDVSPCIATASNMIEYIPRVGEKGGCRNVKKAGVPIALWGESGTELDGEGDKCYKYDPHSTGDVCKFKNVY